MNFSSQLQKDLISGGSIIFSKSKDGLTVVIIEFKKDNLFKTKNKDYYYKRYQADSEDAKLVHVLSLNGRKATVVKQEEERFNDIIEHRDYVSVNKEEDPKEEME